MRLESWAREGEANELKKSRSDRILISLLGSLASSFSCYLSSLLSVCVVVHDRLLRSEALDKARGQIIYDKSV